MQAGMSQVGDQRASGRSPVPSRPRYGTFVPSWPVCWRLGSFSLVGSAVRIEPLAVMARPAGLYDGELTGKGYVN